MYPIASGGPNRSRRSAFQGRHWNGNLSDDMRKAPRCGPEQRRDSLCTVDICCRFWRFGDNLTAIAHKYLIPNDISCPGAKCGVINGNISPTRSKFGAIKRGARVRLQGFVVEPHLVDSACHLTAVPWSTHENSRRIFITLVANVSPRLQMEQSRR